MFEQNDNQNTQRPADYNAYYENTGSASEESPRYADYDYDPGKKPKKPGRGGRVFLRVVAGAAALAIVSVSSIELYKIFGRSDSRQWSDVPEDSISAETQGTTEAQNSSLAASTESAPSWINMAAREDAMSIPDIVEKNLPSVVGVSATFEIENSYSPNSFWGFNFYGDNYGGSQKEQVGGTGTGIIMSEDGYIITNAHCIYDSSSEYKAGKAVSVSVVMEKVKGQENWV